MVNVQGVDVSNWQGQFPWQNWKGKIGFGAVQVGDGLNYADPYFAYDWAGMKAIGIFRFAYLFAQPGQSGPRAQADRLISVARAHGLEHDDHFMLDLEVSDGLPPAEVSRWAQTFCRVVNSSGHRCLVYTNPAFAQAGFCQGLEPWHLWIANYGVSQPTIPAPWNKWVFWQKSGQTIDLDEFNGTQADLETFMSKTG